MKKRINISLLFVLVSLSSLVAQVSLDTLFRNVEAFNQTLLAAEKLVEAEKIAARVGNSPPNPEIEYGYMWGSPEQLGNRVDFAVTQSFDFPTAYTSQSKLSKIAGQQADLRMMATRQSVLVQAHKAWIEAVYLNINKGMLLDRLSQAQQVYEGAKRKYETGDASQLQLNQAFLKTTLLNNELQRTEVAMLNNDNLLKQLAGGKEISISDTVLPASGQMNLDTLYRDYRESPQNQWYENEISRREQEADVAFNKKLPRLMAGYYSEEILNTTLRGIRAGITIPLWGNAHAVNSVKASQAFAESDAWSYQTQQQTRVTGLYQQWEGLTKQVDELQAVIQSADNEYLLLQSVDAGEISLTQYFYESDFFFQSRLALLQTWKELLLVEAELMRVYR